MRINLYTKKQDTFIQALFNRGWAEHSPVGTTAPRHFRNGSFHLILKRGSRGLYCLLHEDRYKYQRAVHGRSIYKGKELGVKIRQVIKEYKRLRS